jgi:pSer/pThr/pTyr-binding forkhead associated (FHA) protein
MELQVPLLAAKALLLLLLFAFIYSVVRRSIGDLRQVPDDLPKSGSEKPARNGHEKMYRRKTSEGPELVVEESDIMAPDLIFQINDDYVSGEHAKITRHGGLLYVEDNGSTNGTYVNGQKAVGATPLRSGDAIGVGSTTFRFVE